MRTGNGPAQVSRERIQGYERRVQETVEKIHTTYPEAAEHSEIWPRIKIVFIGKLMNHLQAECAETFYNSVACRVLHRDYYKSEYIFWRPAISTQYLEGSTPIYRSYYPSSDGLRRSLANILTGFNLANRYENLRRDLRCLEKELLNNRSGKWKAQPNFQIQVLDSLFFRNKAAYIVGRVINGETVQPFVIPLLQNDAGASVCRYAADAPARGGHPVQFLADLFPGGHGGAVGLRVLPAVHHAAQVGGRSVRHAGAAKTGQDPVLPATAVSPEPFARQFPGRAGRPRHGHAGVHAALVPVRVQTDQGPLRSAQDFVAPGRRGKVPAGQTPRPRRPPGRHAGIFQRGHPARPHRSGADEATQGRSRQLHRDRW